MRVHTIRRRFTLVAGSLILGAALAGCGGGSSAAPPVANTALGPIQSQSVASASSFQTETVTRRVTVKPGGTFTFKAATAHAMLPASKSSSASAEHRMTVVYPSDLTYFGGPVMQSAFEYDIYVDSTPQDFSSPGMFLSNLNNSNMIHLTDQYTGATSDGRYKTDESIEVSYDIFGTLGDNDILAILHYIGGLVAPSGSSQNIYNIYLPQGVNYCGTGTIFPAGECNAATGSPAPAFCGFHSEVTFSDVGEVLYTMQPYQDVNYCPVNALFPNATLPQSVQTDSQYSVLLHETFETITDPIPGSGWYDNNAPAVSGEVADLCAYISAQDIFLNKHKYYTQAIYSNKLHGCTIAPPKS